MKISEKKQSSHRKSSVNRRIIGRMLVLIILISAVIIAGYVLIGYQDMVLRAEASLKEYQKDEYYYSNDRTGSLFFTYEYYVGSDILDFFDGSEETMSGYYLSNKDSMVFGNIYKMHKNGFFTVFMPSEDAIWPDNIWDIGQDAEAVLVYCDLTYALSELRRNALVFSAVSAAVALVSFLVSRYTVKMLDKKDQDMKNFFANASHELKTPLMSIRGNADGIRGGYVDKDAGITVIEKEAERMSALISDILDISRLDSGTAEPEMFEYDVREILYDAVSSVIPEAERKGIKLEADLPEPVMRTCDERMIYSAFSNILTNAVRYACSLIRVCSEKTTGGMIRFNFENDGDPISDDGMKHIFDRFYKGEKGQSGIGMALAQEYIKLHNSTINVAVKDGHTVFSIIL